MNMVEKIPAGIALECNGTPLTQTWAYRDSCGTPVGHVARYEENNTKTYRPYFKNQMNQWETGYPDEKLHPLYGKQHRAPQKNGDTLFVVEGEKCVDALHHLGQLALTSPGGAQATRKADWSNIGSFARVIILPDNDEAGMQFARDVSTILGRHQDIECVMIAQLTDLPEKGDVFDFIQRHYPQWDDDGCNIQKERLRIEEVFLLAVESVAIVANSGDTRNGIFDTANTDDSDFVGDVATVAEGGSLDSLLETEVLFPVDALGPILSDAVNALHEIIQAPLALCAQSVLAAVNLGAQAFVDISVNGRVFPVTEFFLSIAVSGERKSTLDSIVLKPIRELERELQETYKNEYHEYKVKKDIYEKKFKRYTDQQSGLFKKNEALINIEDLFEPTPPVNPLLLVSDMTLEGLLKHLLTGYPAVGIFSDEGGTIIGGHAMNPENLLKSLSGFSNFWDAKPVKRLRSGDGIAVIYGRRVAIHLMIQPMVSDMLLGNAMAFEQGFLSRCLVVKPNSTIGTRPFNLMDISCDPRIIAYYKALNRLIRCEIPQHEESKNETAPRTLELTPEAFAQYVEFCNYIESDLKDDGLFESIKGFGCKAGEHALRIAGTLSIFEDPQCTGISDNHVKAGIEIASFYTSECQRLRLLSQQNQEELLSKKLLKWIKEKLAQKPFSVRDIQKDGPRAIRKLGAQGIRTLLQDLASFGDLESKGKEWKLKKSNV